MNRDPRWSHLAVIEKTGPVSPVELGPMTPQLLAVRATNAIRHIEHLPVSDVTGRHTSAHRSAASAFS